MGLSYFQINSSVHELYFIDVHSNITDDAHCIVTGQELGHYLPGVEDGVPCVRLSRHVTLIRHAVVPSRKWS